MNPPLERPAWRISFRLLAGVALGLALVAIIAGRYIYVRYGGYRPLALVHVPTTMRYRARVDFSDQKRVEAIAPLLNILDPRHVRLPALEKKLGVSAHTAAHELAFGSGPEPDDFVLVFGLQLQAETGLPPAQAWCEVLSEDGVRVESGKAGCSLMDGAIVRQTPDGSVVVASKLALVKDLLGMPELGDRLGFSGPSVRGAAPEVRELGREATTLAVRLSSRYP